MTCTAGRGRREPGLQRLVEGLGTGGPQTISGGSDSGLGSTICPGTLAVVFPALGLVTSSERLQFLAVERRAWDHCSR